METQVQSQVHVVDTSVLIGYVDRGDAHHAAARKALAASRSVSQIVISTVTYAEMLVGAFSNQGTAEAVDHLLSVLPITTFPVTDAVAIGSARIRAEHPTLELPDSLIIATAQILNADRLLTADARWSRITSLVELIKA